MPSGGLWIQVGAPFRVPDQCDAVHVVAWRGDAGGPVLFDEVRSLGNSQFPATLALLTSDASDFDRSGVEVQVDALSGGTAIPCASGIQQAVLQRHALVQVDFELGTCNAPP